MSDDEAHALTLIAFVGSVFSPYYAWARRRGEADPSNHCAFNVALYGRRGGRWCMTERGAARLGRESSILSIGPSAMSWTGDALQISVDEVCAPIPRRLRGSIRLTPTALCEKSFVLDEQGSHLWSPIAPCARVEVHLSDPQLTWTGAGYFDSNTGAEPVENGFDEWDWSRASLPDRTTVLYDFKPRRSPRRTLALQFAPQGAIAELPIPPLAPLPSTRWRLRRQTRADAGHCVEVVRTLEDGPFYSRSLLHTSLLGRPVRAVHESLSLHRFRSPWVQCLLPFRMPRIAG